MAYSSATYTIVSARHQREVNDFVCSLELQTTAVTEAIYESLHNSSLPVVTMSNISDQSVLASSTQRKTFQTHHQINRQRLYLDQMSVAMQCRDVGERT